MKILGLDISTKTGYALLQFPAQLVPHQVASPELLEYGYVRALAVDESQDVIEDIHLLNRAETVAQQIHDLIVKYQPDWVFLEQTNASSWRTSQKLLEFIHCLVLQKSQACPTPYNNLCYIDTSQWKAKLHLRMSKEHRKHNQRLRTSTKSNLMIGTKITRGRITAKHLAIDWVYREFSLALKFKDHDIADAIGIAYAGGIVIRERALYNTDYLSKFTKI